MSTLIHADIFFFVTTIAVIIVTLLFTIALIYLIRVLRQVEQIGKEIKAEAILVRGDISELRSTVKKQGFKLQAFTTFAKSIFNLKKHFQNRKNKK